jgi:hypothetical protein
MFVGATVFIAAIYAADLHWYRGQLYAAFGELFTQARHHFLPR